MIIDSRDLKSKKGIDDSGSKKTDSIVLYQMQFL
jgi:hypothetical protein